MKVTAILKGKKDDQGRIKICIRIADKGVRTFRTTMMRVTPSQFASGRVKDHPQAKAYNERLRVIINQIEGELLQGTVAKTERVPFAAYVQDLMRRWEKSKRPGTMRQIATERKKFMDYAGDILLTDIDTELLQGYEHHMREMGNGSNTVWKSFKFIRMICLRAFKDKKIREYIFATYPMPRYKTPIREYLEEEELVKVEGIAYNPAASPEVRFIASWFVLGCYTGLRFSDWQQFNQATHIRGGRLVLYTTKTGQVVSMPVVDKVRSLFENIEYKPCHYTNTHVNRVLKEIATGAGIDKNLSAHISRHTFGVRAARVMSLEACARLMGITVRVCQVYYKIVDVTSDREYEKMFK
jgi:integrase